MIWNVLRLDVADDWAQMVLFGFNDRTSRQAETGHTGRSNAWTTPRRASPSIEYLQSEDVGWTERRSVWVVTVISPCAIDPSQGDMQALPHISECSTMQAGQKIEEPWPGSHLETWESALPCACIKFLCVFSISSSECVDG